MSERTSRGYMVQSVARYIDGTYDDEARRQILGRIDPDVRRMMESVNPVAWYPVQDVAKIFAAIAGHHEATDGNPRQALENVGRSIAEMATTMFLKLVLRILTPALFASKLPQFWSRDNRCGTLRTVEFESGKKRLVATLDDVGDFDFIGAVAPGFLLFALEHLGYKNVRVDYEWTPESARANSFRYELTWD